MYIYMITRQKVLFLNSVRTVARLLENLFEYVRESFNVIPNENSRSHKNICKA